MFFQGWLFIRASPFSHSQPCHRRSIVDRRRPLPSPSSPSLTLSLPPSFSASPYLALCHGPCLFSPARFVGAVRHRLSPAWFVSHRRGSSLTVSQPHQPCAHHIPHFSVLLVTVHTHRLAHSVTVAASSSSPSHRSRELQPRNQYHGSGSAAPAPAPAPASSSDASDNVNLDLTLRL
ncbi:hypothetical protein PIB30_017834 [Stylosanthes scabra]|uniref:Uncharacterized protein n=1 Tax=Stylosanthes scabra TaxID=79078 RepID=A0ABU6W7F2_9FABA|nr:hypothetical protein [Stylosanthes scabra]